MASKANTPTYTYPQPRWWKEAVVYQIYPSSFQSHPGNKTGWGSIQGITSRLDYLQRLGVNVLWSSPFLKSPQEDMGYDIADYKEVDPRYGCLADVDHLIAELKKREMRLLIDLVVNHTSDQHAWFLESRSSRDNPKRTWYIWRDPKGFNADGTPQPPNNWAQILGEANSAWTYDETTKQFYLNIFTPQQPDLNWENTEVRAAVHDVMHFWLSRGASGFRMDVINMISKVQTFPDADVVLPPGHLYQPAWKYVVNGPRLHEWLREMHDRVLSQYGEEVLTIGEMPRVSDADEILRTVGAHAGELREIFIFDLVDIDCSAVRMTLKPWTVKEMKSIVTRWQKIMVTKDGWNSVFIENHDNPRSVSRYTDDSDGGREMGAKMLALMQGTLGGTLFVYQGEEIGMRNIRPGEWDVEEEFKDIETLNFWKKSLALYGDDPEKMKEARRIVDAKARDHARTPMQWDGSANAGFCDDGVKPWMRVMGDWKTVNANAQMSGAESSVWGFWQSAIKRRKDMAHVFVYGDYKEVEDGSNEEVFAYVRTSFETGERWIVVLNFSGNQVQGWVVDGLEVERWEVGSYGDGVGDKSRKGGLELRPWEGLLGKLV